MTEIVALVRSASSKARPYCNGTSTAWDTDTNTQFASFLPSEDMTYYLNFFDQFARSHRLWSADSRYLVYGERTPSGERVSLIDVAGDGSATTITEGGHRDF